MGLEWGRALLCDIMGVGLSYWGVTDILFVRVGTFKLYICMLVTSLGQGGRYTVNLHAVNITSINWCIYCILVHTYRIQVHLQHGEILQNASQLNIHLS